MPVLSSRNEYFYEKGLFDIYYENDSKTVKYIVSNIGSTMLCFDEARNLGMGSVTNFSIEHFYGIEKPKKEEPVIDSSIVDSSVNA